MKNKIILWIIMLVTAFNAGCDEQNYSTEPESLASIDSFKIEGDNPTISPDISFSIQTSGEVTGYLIHERKPEDDNQSIMPNRDDSRWQTVKPSHYVLQDKERYGSRVLYLFIKDKNSVLAERKSVIFNYQNPNPVFSYVKSNFAGGFVIDPTIAVYEKTIYIACGVYVADKYSSSRTKYSPLVLKSDDDGQTWESIYTSSDKAMFTSIAVDDSGKLYLAMCSAAQDGKLVVLKYSGKGTSWSFLGSSEGISSDTVNYVNIKIQNEKLYAACKDYGVGGAVVYVCSLRTGIWEALGSSAASEGDVSDIDLLISKTGTVYISYCDESFSRKTSVRYFDSTDGWKYLGSRGISSDIGTYPKLAETDDGIAVLYRDGTINSKPAVKLFNKGTWKDLGPLPCNGKMSAANGELVFCQGSLFAFFKEEVGGGSLRCSCMKYFSGKWNYAGGQGFSSYSVDYINAISSDNSIFLVFKDWGENYTYGLSLVKFY
ncbi:MAG TPA: hypothetical protein PK624_14225 [Spirochaetota bacterium]|nr:hypothetical protein [Spirochaetota bacterium]HOR45947.1 hypothetical protein [Spirochaetota bacterium]